MNHVAHNERGIALVITLLVVALLTITVIEFTYSVQVDQHMARNALSGLQASLLARSGINLGEAFLLHDSDFTVDAFTEDWCPDPAGDGHACHIDETSGQVMLPQNMRLKVQIVDEGGKLNLNMVRFTSQRQWNDWRTNRNGDPKTQGSLHPLLDWQSALEQLLSSRGLPPEIAEQVLDYWDAVFQARFAPGDTGSATSPGRTPPPVAIGTPDPITTAQLQQLEFASLDDAAVIPGMTQSAINKLRPVLTALPSSLQPKVNANTAPVTVLNAIVGDDEVAGNIVSQRSETPLKPGDLGSLTAGLNRSGTGPAGHNYATVMLGVTSQFYQVRASGVVNPNPITGRGGIGRSATMLVRRTRRAATQGNSASAVPWTLIQLDWQKEGGAALFQAQGDQDPDMQDQPAMPGAGG